MPKYSYKAKKTPTELIEGIIEADSTDHALDKIIKLGLSPFDVALDESPAKKPSPKTASQPAYFSSRIQLADIGLLMRQLSDLVDAGVPLLRGLHVTRQQTKNSRLQEIVQNMHDFVQDGGTLSEAMAMHGLIFSRLHINMVKAGEASGNLDVVLNRLAELIDRDIEVRSKVQSSLIYPALILTVGFLTIFVLLTFVVPRLTVIFEDFSESLPLPTVILIAVSNIFARFWWLIAGCIALGIFYFKKFTRSPEGKTWLDKTKLQIPIFGSFICDVEVGRFARTLTTLLESGVVIVTALDSVWPVLDNDVIKEEIKQASSAVASGDSLTAALKKCPHMPEVVTNIIAVGEESGHLEQSILKLAESYERKSDKAVKIFTSLLEPAMIIVIGLIVFFIVMAVILPILKMNQMIK